MYAACTHMLARLRAVGQIQHAVAEVVVLLLARDERSILQAMGGRSVRVKVVLYAYFQS